MKSLRLSSLKAPIHKIVPIVLGSYECLRLLGGLVESQKPRSRPCFEGSTM
jgi:hypothetical protein